MHRQTIVEVHTRPRRIHDVTRDVATFVSEARPSLGLLTILCLHTSASLMLQENADPAVLHDFERFFEHLVPERFPWEHDAEGPDDMPAHVRAALTSPSLTIPVRDGRLILGTWQGIYLWEHRAHAHTRRLVLHLIAE